MNCQLTSISPSIANTGDTIVMEGTFEETVVVNFPGGTSVPAIVMGTHRAAVVIPASATAGDLTLTACGTTIGPLPFRRASFPLGLGTFDTSLDQINGARQASRLMTARDSHTTAVIGRYIYLVGGVGVNESLATLEQATINADGSISIFSPVSGVALATARQAHSMNVTHDRIFAIGGFGSAPLNSIEQASIAPDGSLGPFAIIPDVALATARHSHTSAIIGNHIYVVGGFGSTALNTVEQSIINTDGSLGPFTPITTSRLAIPRYGHSSIAIGGHLYVIGGTGNMGALDQIERAAINPDGSLGPFAVANITLKTGRSAHSMAVVGPCLYVIGGISSIGSLTDIERACFDDEYSLEQFATLSEVMLRRARQGHTTALVGNYLYVLGGSSGNATLNDTERATVNAGGSVESLSSAQGVTLSIGRQGHAAVVSGQYIYVLDGSAVSAPQFERAVINTDGSLSPFIPVEHLAFVISRSSYTVATIGRYLYVIGGAGGAAVTPQRSIERAVIDSDGSLGSFLAVNNSSLAKARAGHTSAVIGNRLYVLGGRDDNQDILDSIEYATINNDDTLGPFTIVPDVTLATARQGHHNLVSGGSIYIYGGLTPAGFQKASIREDFSLSTFVTLPVALMTPRAGPSAVIGRYLYALWGTRGLSSEVNSVDRAIINQDDSLGSFATFADITAQTVHFGGSTTIAGNYLYNIGGSGVVSGDLLFSLNKVDSGQLK